MKNYPVLLTVMLGLLASGCSLWGRAPTADQPTAAHLEVKSVSLFMSKGADFEQYQLRGQNLYGECGTLVEGTSKLKDQKFVQLPEKVSAEVLRVATATSEMASKQAFEGTTNQDIAAVTKSGAFSLILRSDDTQQNLETTFEQVAKPNDATSRGLRSLARVLRVTAGGKMCGNRDFYGLSKR